MICLKILSASSVLHIFRTIRPPREKTQNKTYCMQGKEEQIFQELSSSVLAVSRRRRRPRRRRRRRRHRRRRRRRRPCHGLPPARVFFWGNSILKQSNFEYRKIQSKTKSFFLKKMVKVSSQKYPLLMASFLWKIHFETIQF